MASIVPAQKLIATRDALKELVATLREQHKKIAFSNGCFELLHVGHLRSLQGARQHGDCLIVAVNSDASVRRYKGREQPIVPEQERAEIIAGLAKVKANCDSGIFTAIQHAGIAALKQYDEFVPGLVEMYRKRRDTFCSGLNRIGWKVKPPAATVYGWIPVPDGQPSGVTASRILDEAEIVLTPGHGFGKSGEGFVRATLTVTEERLAEVADVLGAERWRGAARHAMWLSWLSRYHSAISSRLAHHTPSKPRA